MHKDKFDECGVLRFPDDSRYVGFFREGQYNEFGVYFYPDGHADVRFYDNGVLKNVVPNVLPLKLTT
jgi:hypothetical protein